MVISREGFFFLISLLSACWIVTVQGFCFVPADTTLRSVSCRMLTWIFKSVVVIGLR